MESFSHINDELGQIQTKYTEKMNLLNKFKSSEFSRIMRAVDLEQKALDVRKHTMNREIEEFKV